MSKRMIKTGWHGLLAVLAIVEFNLADTTLRKLLCGGCCGWHTAAMLVDFNDKEEK